MGTSAREGQVCPRQNLLSVPQPPTARRQSNPKEDLQEIPLTSFYRHAVPAVLQPSDSHFEGNYIMEQPSPASATSYPFSGAVRPRVAQSSHRLVHLEDEEATRMPTRIRSEERPV